MVLDDYYRFIVDSKMKLAIIVAVVFFHVSLANDDDDDDGENAKIVGALLRIPGFKSDSLFL
jgi:hypothetical protein